MDSDSNFIAFVGLIIYVGIPWLLAANGYGFILPIYYFLTVGGAIYFFAIHPFVSASREKQDQVRAHDAFMADRYIWPSVDQFTARLDFGLLASLPAEVSDGIKTALREFYVSYAALGGTHQVETGPYLNNGIKYSRLSVAEGTERYESVIATSNRAFKEFNSQLEPSFSGAGKSQPSLLKANLISSVGFEVFEHALISFRKAFWDVGPLLECTNFADYRLYEKEASQAERERVNKQLVANYGAADARLIQAFHRSPLYPCRSALRQTFWKLETPFRFPIATNPTSPRYEGHLITGNSGAGKTTYLSNLIANDLVHVANGECSLVVMDSQEQLIPELARNKIFAPGQPLEGRLIYIEPDDAHPLAINLLDVPANRQALRMIEFFMQSVSQMDTSGNMDTLIATVVPAVMTIPGATIFTLQKFMREGYDAFANRIRISPDDRAELRDMMRAPEFKMSVGAVKARLAAFTRDPYFKLMFRPPKSKLDLAEELQWPTVILINTSMSKLASATPDFGRFWIAKLLQAVETRIGMRDEDKLPVLAYIDEAEQYIKEEPNVEELIDRARKQFLSLTLAIKEERQITNSSVKAALERMAIVSRLSKRGEASVSIRNQAQPTILTYDKLRFKDTPLMTENQWRTILNGIHYRYCYVPDVWTPGDDETTAQTPPGASRHDPFDDDIKPS